MIQAGWSFEMQEDHMYMSTRIFARSSYGVFGSGYIDHLDIRQSNKGFPFIYFSREVVVQAKHLVERIEMPVTQMMPIEVGEAYPSTGQQFELMTYERKEIAVPQKQDILVTPEDIPELLQKIQEAQKPRAREILAKQRQRNKLDEYQVQAKILSFGS